MSTPFKLPQLGETVAEGTITRWLKKEGESVEADEPLVEISTDKVDSEIPAPTAGIVTKILFQEGETVQVGAVIAEIGEAGEAAEPQAAAAEAPAAEKTEAPEESEAAEPEADEPEPAEAAPAEPVPVAAAQTATAAPPAQMESSQEEPRRGILSPLVRKLAAEHDIDLAALKGTGTGGRITKQDVQVAIESGATAAAVPAPAPAPQSPAEKPAPAAASSPERASAPAPPSVMGGEEVVKISNMRKSIAEHMVSSLHETARAWNAVEVDMTGIAHLRKRAGAAFKAREGFSLTWMPFISKAACQALLKFPQVNATWNGDGTITRKHYVNLGIAVALENGLIVPVVKGADGMNVAGLSRAVRDIADRARSKKLSPDEVHGGTFTVTNPGPFGSILSVPIINKGQAAILATDAVVKRPVVVTDEHGNDSIAIRHMLFVSMSWDHRVIDGAEAAQFLAHMKAILEEADFESDLSGYLTD